MLRTARRGLTTIAIAGAMVSPSATAVSASATVSPHACAPCTYTVTPTGTGAQSIAFVLANLVHAGDIVVMTDGVYQVANLQVSQPNVTIEAHHVPKVGAQPTVWLDGSIPYRYWTHNGGSTWSHPYTKDFCDTTLFHMPCGDVGIAEHSDQVFKGNTAIPQSAAPLTGDDFGDPGPPSFYVDTDNHLLSINFDPGTDTTVTDKETALAFTSGAQHSALIGVGVRKYAGNDHNAGDLANHQNAAVYVDDATVAFQRDSFSFNSVRGMKTQGDVPPAQAPVAGSGVLVDRSTFDHNGELGLDSVDSDGIIVHHSLFYRNNTAGFYEGSESGGAKLLSTYGAEFVDNTFGSNIGMGLWFDRSSYGATVAGNVFQDNTWNGFLYEISAHAVVTGNTGVGNGRAAMLVYESSQVSLSHNLLRGNLVGIEVQEGTRTFANFPSGHDSDPDRTMPSDITFDVRAIDIHANGFYYAPSPHTYVQCQVGATEQVALDGCQYQLAVEDDLGQRDASVLGITTTHDNFHRQNWPADPVHARVPVFIAMWQARPQHATSSGCIAGASASRELQWPALADFECTGQEAGAATPFAQRGSASRASTNGMSRSRRIGAQ